MHKHCSVNPPYTVGKDTGIAQTSKSGRTRQHKHAGFISRSFTIPTHWHLHRPHRSACNARSWSAARRWARGHRPRAGTPARRRRGHGQRRPQVSLHTRTLGRQRGDAGSSDTNCERNLKLTAPGTLRVALFLKERRNRSSCTRSGISQWRENVYKKRSKVQLKYGYLLILVLNDSSVLT